MQIKREAEKAVEKRAKLEIIDLNSWRKQYVSPKYIRCMSGVHLNWVVSIHEHLATTAILQSTPTPVLKCINWLSEDFSFLNHKNFRNQ